VRTSFIEQAQDPVGGTPEQFAQLVREDYDKYERLVRELNIKTN
jgi:tripartite-type tricarboxylate transporter receptor subunit TctC